MASWGENLKVYVIATDYGLLTTPSVKFEPHYIDDITCYYTFADRFDKTNVLIKFDASELNYDL